MTEKSMKIFFMPRRIFNIKLSKELSLTSGLFIDDIQHLELEGLKLKLGLWFKLSSKFFKKFQNVWKFRIVLWRGRLQITSRTKNYFFDHKLWLVVTSFQRKIFVYLECHKFFKLPSPIKCDGIYEWLWTSFWIFEDF